MNKALNKIEVEGFKSIGLMSLELHSLNVLIGANGAGKSNLLGAFKLLNEISRGNLQVYVATCGGADALLRFGRKKTAEIQIELSVCYHQYECMLAPTADDRLIFASELVSFRKEAPLTESWSLGSGHSESGLIPLRREPQRKSGKPSSQYPSETKQYVLQYLRGFAVYHFQDSSYSAGVKYTVDLDDNQLLRGDGANLAAFLYRLREKNPGDYSNIVQAVRLVFPFFDDFSLEPSRLNPDKIRLEWREQGSDAYFNASALSDGTLRFICLATLLLQPDLPSTILLDEPELGLHPYAINVLAELLRGAATKTQVICSTQSVGLVNQFEPEDVIVVEREDQQSVFRHLDRADMESWLDDYGLGDLWEKNIIGGRP